MYKNCKYLVEKERRIALYEPDNDSNVYAAYPTLEAARKDYNIPEDVEIEQGLGQLFIAVPYSAKKEKHDSSNILKVARLIRALEQEDRSRESKIEIINMYKGIGVITAKEGLELYTEYCY